MKSIAYSKNQCQSAGKIYYETTEILTIKIYLNRIARVLQPNIF